MTEQEDHVHEAPPASINASRSRRFLFPQHPELLTPSELRAVNNELLIYDMLRKVQEIGEKTLSSLLEIRDRLNGENDSYATETDSGNASAGSGSAGGAGDADSDPHVPSPPAPASASGNSHGDHSASETTSGSGSGSGTHAMTGGATDETPASDATTVLSPR